MTNCLMTSHQEEVGVGRCSGSVVYLEGQDDTCPLPWCTTHVGIALEGYLRRNRSVLVRPT